jgi:hypothetical protein
LVLKYIPICFLEKLAQIGENKYPNIDFQAQWLYLGDRSLKKGSMSTSMVVALSSQGFGLSCQHGRPRGSR